MSKTLMMNKQMCDQSKKGGGGGEEEAKNKSSCSKIQYEYKDVKALFT